MIELRWVVIDEDERKPQLQYRVIEKISKEYSVWGEWNSVETVYRAEYEKYR